MKTMTIKNEKTDKEHFFICGDEILYNPAFKVATDSQVGTWAILVALCKRFWGHGRIRNASLLQTSFFITYGIEKAEVLEPSPLWFFDGDDLVLKFYHEKPYHEYN